MAKNILIVTGSPRVGGNSDILAEAFAKGAMEAGHSVKTFAAGRADIKPCKVCDACKAAGKCIFEDDFRLQEGHGKRIGFDHYLNNIVYRAGSFSLRNKKLSGWATYKCCSGCDYHCFV